MEWNRDPRNKPSHVRSCDFQQGCQDHSMGESIVFSTNVLGKLNIHIQKSEVELSILYHIQKVTTNGPET